LFYGPYIAKGLTGIYARRWNNTNTCSVSGTDGVSQDMRVEESLYSVQGGVAVWGKCFHRNARFLGWSSG